MENEHPIEQLKNTKEIGIEMPDIKVLEQAQATLSEFSALQEKQLNTLSEKIKSYEIEGEDIKEEYKNESSKLSHLTHESLEKLKNSLRVLGVVLPLAFGVGNANAGEGSPSSPEFMQLQSIGGHEKISKAEWKIYQKYNQYVFDKDHEIVDTYVVLPNGEVVDIEGEITLGKIGTAQVLDKGVEPSNSEVISQIESLSKRYPEGVVHSIHQHPLSAYHDVASQLPVEQMFKNVNPQDIKDKKTFSAWPPSYPDISNVVVNEDTVSTVVDAGGVWKYSLDKDSTQGKEMAAKITKLSSPEYIESLLQDRNLEISDYKAIYKTVSEEGQKNLENKYSPETIEGVIEAFTELDQSLSQALTGDKNSYKYQDQQLHVAVTTTDKKEWTQKINDYIEYCHKQGFRMTYTPFDQTPEK